MSLGEIDTELYIPSDLSLGTFNVIFRASSPRFPAPISHLQSEHPQACERFLGRRSLSHVTALTCQGI